MINSIYNVNGFELKGVNSKNLRSVGGSFSKLLEDSLDKINNFQNVADQSIVSFIKGDENEIHNVMIAMEEAKLTMQTAIEVRNKLVEAYQELSKTQI